MKMYYNFDFNRFTINHNSDGTFHLSKLKNNINVT